MIFIYSILIVLLGMVHFLLKWHANRLGRRYSTLAQRAQQLVRELSIKPGNSGRADPCVSAKGQFALALAVNQRDKVEARHFTWQSWAENLGRWTAQLRQWKGLKLPYTMGVADVGLILAAIDYLGFSELVSARSLVVLAMTWLR